MTKQELQDAISKLDTMIASLTGVQGKEERLAIAIKKREELQAELAAMEGAEEKPMTKLPPAQEGDAVSAILASLSHLMTSGGGGADSFEVRKMIEEILSEKKISLEELDASVLEEIRKNQRVILELPRYDLTIQMDSDDTKIPHIYEMIDDVLAGNNIYLIGDAGSGKTYSAQLLGKILKREISMINCSQYTSPTEIIGGQTIEGYKDGKLILAWSKGKILLLDEMPKLDPNTAGLLNDALAKSSKTVPDNLQFINSANPDQPPFERNKDFAVIATGNIYPNTNDTRRYVGNNQQDLSLLDRFSGGVYYVNYDKYIDQKSCRYNFLYEMLVGNYYAYMDAKKEKTGVPEPKGLRTVLEDTNGKNYALTSYRTLIAFRVAFEYQLIRAMTNKGKPKNEQVPIDRGKTVLKAWHSYLVAFDETAKKTLLDKTKFTDAYITRMTNEAIDMIVNGGLEGFTKALTPDIRDNAKKAFEESQSWIAMSDVAKI